MKTSNQRETPANASLTQQLDSTWREMEGKLRRRARLLCKGDVHRADELLSDTALKVHIYLQRSPDRVQNLAGFLFLALIAGETCSGMSLLLVCLRPPTRRGASIGGSDGARRPASSWRRGRLPLHGSVRRHASAAAGVTRPPPTSAAAPARQVCFFFPIVSAIAITSASTAITPFDPISVAAAPALAGPSV